MSHGPIYTVDLDPTRALYAGGVVGGLESTLEPSHGQLVRLCLTERGLRLLENLPEYSNAYIDAEGQFWFDGQVIDVVEVHHNWDEA